MTSTETQRRMKSISSERLQVPWTSRTPLSAFFWQRRTETSSGPASPGSSQKLLPVLAALYLSHHIAQMFLKIKAGSEIGVACRLLELPLPEMDDLDRVTWNVSSAEVSKAYR